MYCLYVNVYCHRVTTQLQLTNISYHIVTSPLKSFYSRLRIRDVPASSLGPKFNYCDWGHTVFLGWQPCEVVDIIRRSRDELHLQHQSYDRNWYSACSDVPEDIWRRVVIILTMQVASLSVLHSFFASCLTSFLLIYMKEPTWCSLAVCLFVIAIYCQAALRWFFYIY